MKLTDLHFDALSATPMTNDREMLQSTRQLFWDLRKEGLVDYRCGTGLRWQWIRNAKGDEALAAHEAQK